LSDGSDTKTFATGEIETIKFNDFEHTFAISASAYPTNADGIDVEITRVNKVLPVTFIQIKHISSTFIFDNRTHKLKLTRDNPIAIISPFVVPENQQRQIPTPTTADEIELDYNSGNFDIDQIVVHINNIGGKCREYIDIDNINEQMTHIQKFRFDDDSTIHIKNRAGKIVIVIKSR